jgi:hypothetical protein
VKQCTDCGKDKPLSSYYRLTKQRTGLNPRCKVCVNRRNQAYADANPERTLEWKRRAALRRWAKTHLRMDQHVLEALMARANDQCEAGCGRASTAAVSRKGNSYRLTLDHDHATGIVRGMLCWQCNTALGLVDDDPTLLRKLAEYLEHPPGVPSPAEFAEQVQARQQSDVFLQSKRPATGWRQSAESRAKIATAQTGRPSPFKGVPRSPEVVEKIRLGHLGKKRSDEARANIRAARLRSLAKKEDT